MRCWEELEFQMPESLQRSTLYKVQDSDGNTPQNTGTTKEFAARFDKRCGEYTSVKGQHGQFDEGGTIGIRDLSS